MDGGSKGESDGNGGKEVSRHEGTKCVDLENALHLYSDLTKQ